jgi:hypothetical protein
VNNKIGRVNVRDLIENNRYITPASFTATVGAVPFPLAADQGNIVLKPADL